MKILTSSMLVASTMVAEMASKRIKLIHVSDLLDACTCTGNC